MARKVRITDADTEKFGIKVTYSDGRSGWIVGGDCDYMLFDSQSEAEKALRRMKRDDRYTWNCDVQVTRFTK